jgi:hypothetical protein
MALLQAHRLTRETTYFQMARRILETMGPQVAAGLSPEPDEAGGAAAGASAFLLRAFALADRQG